MAEITPPPCPAYLGGQLERRWEALAPELVKLGTLDDLNADVLGKYILAENEYLRISQLLQDAINRGDRYCCAGCPRYSICRNPCLNSPERCGLEDKGGRPAEKPSRINPKDTRFMEE